MTPFLFGDELFGTWNWVDGIIRTIIVVLVMTIIVMYLIYGERKVVARFQQRLGPTRTGPAGLLQSFADAAKLVGKEDIRPHNADRWVFEFAPYATFIPVFMTLAVLPFAEDWGVRNLTLGLFFVFAVLGLEIVGVMMAGLGSGNKFALLGGVRAAAQMISYEIPLVLSLLAVAMIAGTLDLNVIAAQQDRYPYIILQPLAFLIFFTAMLSELHRAPFDIPVAESEIVGGYFVEYSGIRWSMFMLSEYAALWAFSIFGAVIFLGGWQFPMGDDWGWGWQLFLTFAKSAMFIFAMFWMRATVPRLRIDQLMAFCWKVLLPLSLLQILANGFVLIYGWSYWWLAVSSGVGAALLVAVVINRAFRRRTSRGLVGAYRTQLQVPAP
jgi:NADH-quinone oxidoreductase subunit H